MGSLTISIPDDLEIKFRRLSRRKFGDKHGRLSRAATEAFMKWCKENRK